MAAAEYVVASQSPSLYIETVTGDKPTSALSTGDRYTDLDGLTSAWNGAAWVSLPAGGAVTPAAIGEALTQPTGGMSAIPDARTLLAALALHEDWGDEDEATGTLMGLEVWGDGSLIKLSGGIGVIADGDEGIYRAYLIESLVSSLNITDLFSAAHETLDRIDLVVGRITDTATGAAAIQVVEGTPGTQLNEVWTFTQTGSPGGGTVTLASNADPMGALAWNANEAAIQNYFDTYVGGDPGTKWTIAGNAASFTATFIEVLGGPSGAVFTLAANDLTGGTSPSVTMEITQVSAFGAMVPALPSYALLLGQFTIEAGETDPADWTLDLTSVPHLSLSPTQLGLTGVGRVWYEDPAIRVEAEDFSVNVEETLSLAAGEIMRLSSTGDALDPQIHLESGALAFFGATPTFNAAARPALAVATDEASVVAQFNLLRTALIAAGLAVAG